MLSETEVIVRATRSRVASVPGELSFSVGDVIVYLPQRGRSGATGMAMGRLGAGEGLFPPSFTELANDSSVSAPAAHPLALEPDAGGASSAIDQQRGMPILPQGRQSLRLAVWDVFNDPESCKAAQVVMIWVMSLIIISTIAFVAESMPEFHVRGGPGAVSSQNARQISLLLSLLPQSLTLTRARLWPRRSHVARVLGHYGDGNRAAGTSSLPERGGEPPLIASSPLLSSPVRPRSSLWSTWLGSSFALRTMPRTSSLPPVSSSSP